MVKRSVGRVLPCRPAGILVIALTLAIALPGFAQTTRRAGPVDSSRTEDVNRRNPDGSTPLQWAVYNGDVVEARRLLRAGRHASSTLVVTSDSSATPSRLKPNNDTR